ncbi:MAG: hypothetical protein CVV02_17850 [Firmicutes bacterium HGW-Firmicutes-7]|nr:MAG: hypothetical protein CVV02_17850 [Firmicutes bacterium HGW-Firmicutes-7]
MDGDNRIADLIQLFKEKGINFSIKDILHQNNVVVLVVDLESSIKSFLINQIRKILGIKKLYQVQPLFGKIKDISPLFKNISEMINLAKRK